MIFDFIAIFKPDCHFSIMTITFIDLLRNIKYKYITTGRCLFFYIHGNFSVHHSGIQAVIEVCL